MQDFKGAPPWHSMSLFNYIATRGGVFVSEITYYPFEPYQVEVKTKDSLEYLAVRNYEREAIRWRRTPTLFLESEMIDTQDFSCTHTEQKIDEFLNMVDLYMSAGQK